MQDHRELIRSGKPYGDASSWRGHGVLEIPVPQLEPYVRARTGFYDPAFVSTDTRFCHAHITLLAPFFELPDPADVGRVIATLHAFDFRLADFHTFPGGLIHLRPQPQAPFRHAISALIAAFPDVIAYGGPDPVPHLSLDVVSESVSLESTRMLVGGLVPAHCHARCVDMCWFESDHCTVLNRWCLD